MIIPIAIRGQTINFCVSPALDSLEARVRVHIEYLVAALNMIPRVHLQLLNEVPIVIRGGEGKGGWVAPTRGGAGEGGEQNELYDGWLTGRRGRRFGVQEDLNSLPNSNGIIHMTDVALFRTAVRCQLTLLHETGHCVDYHLNLNSTPSAGDRAYRHGNRAYQGQRYPGSAYNYHEFKAETYSRLFLTPNRLCRGNDARPSCLSSGSHNYRECNERFRRDLANSPAFAIAGADGQAVLGLEPTISDSEGQSEEARGPAGRAVVSGVEGSQLLARTTPPRPGPAGRV